jgi:putative FmdB family regulatory protein
LKPDKLLFLVKYMPIYEYRCESCGVELEKIQKFSDEPLTDCPSCGKSSLKKLVSASSFRLKGSGWYETDFKNKNKPASGATTATPAATKAGNSDKDSSAAAKSGETGSQDKKESKGSEKASAKASKDSNKG